METLLSTVDRILVALQDDYHGDKEIRSQHLCLTVKEKLPVDYVREYKYWLSERDEDDDFEKLVQWIERRVCIMDEAREETGEFVKQPHKDGGRRHNHGFNADKKVRRCIVPKCDIDHPPWVCPEFKKFPVTKRNQLIAKSGRCFSCLAAGHRTKNCERKRKSGIDGCESKGHSSLLHDPDRMSKVSTGQDKPNPSNPPSEEADAKTYTTNQVEQISLMVLPATVENGHKKLKVNVMLDPCSTGSYVTESVAEELQLKGEKQDLTISGTGGTEIKRQSKRVRCSVTSISGNFSSPVEANVLANITGNTPAIEWNELKSNWPHLNAIQFETVSKRKQIDILVGSDHPVFHKVLREVTGHNPKNPVARQMPLGWVCFGPISKKPSTWTTQSHMTRTYKTEHAQEVSDNLRHFWELEAIGIKDGNVRPLTPDEKKAVEIVRSTQTLVNGRYEVGVPWKDGEPDFSNNYDMAYSRLQKLESSLRKKTEVAKAYNETISDYLEKDYIKKVSKKTEDQWLLPHFAVVNEKKTSTKVRVVFDAAAKHENKSLNDALHPGPKLQ